MSQNAPNKIANRLVVLSSAAVLTVYAAGYVRTQAAADRLSERISKRRPAAQVEQGTTEPASVDNAVQQRDRSPELAIQPSANEPQAVAVPSPTALPAENLVNSSVETAVAAPSAVIASKQFETPVTAATEPVPVPPTPAVAPTAQPLAQPPAPPKKGWRDGTYKGWGDSRHGSIEATVVVEGGRILSATISTCQTRYPCDYIENLPPQVAQRQSADVDVVSRVTESSDAFYYAVTGALAESLKAK